MGSSGLYASAFGNLIKSIKTIYRFLRQLAPHVHKSHLCSFFVWIIHTFDEIQ